MRKRGQASLQWVKEQHTLNKPSIQERLKPKKKEKFENIRMLPMPVYVDKVQLLEGDLKHL
jgi:hypothetical protein